MNIIIPFTEFVNYVLFSLLTGYVLLQFVPETKKPKIIIPEQAILLSTLGIIICTFMPLLKVILYFKDNVGIKTSIISVIIDFQIGHAWLFISIISTFLLMTIVIEGSKYFQALWLILMMLGVGYASHVTSISFWPGLLSHSIHLLVVTVWVGTLLHVGWFSRDKSNWLEFLKWFTPLAQVSLILILASGFTLMYYVVDQIEYLNTWVLPYGRVLLIKHISIIPVLVFAIINGRLMKKTITLPTFNPQPWIKAESILLLIVFYCTGVLGTLPPPHEVSLSGTSTVGPTWTEWLLVKNILPSLQVKLSATLQSGTLILISFIFLLLIINSFKKLRPALGIFLGCIFVITMYLGLMFSVSFTQ